MAIADKLTAVNNAKTAIKNAIEAKGVTVGSAPLADYASKIAAIPTGSSIPANARWIRNPEWPALPTVTSSDHKFVGLYAVFPDGPNLFTFTAAGAYIINMGVGAGNVSQASGATYTYEYNYSDSALVGTEKPVTLTTSTNRIGRTAHGKKDGDSLEFYNLSASVGLQLGVQYYVINSTANDFQVSLTSGGSAVAISANATASLLPYRIALVTVTATSTLTSVNIDNKHASYVGTTGTTGWLDIAMAGTLTTIGTATTNRYDWLQSLQIFNTSATTLASLCNGWSSLKSAKIWNSPSNTNFNNVFYNCYSLKDVYIKDSSLVTNWNQSFIGCAALEEAPVLDLSSATTVASMFQNCYSLRSVPAYSAPLATTAASMFNQCESLKRVNLTFGNPLTTINLIFRYCYSLLSIKITYTGSSTTAITTANAFQNILSTTEVIMQGWKSSFSVTQMRLTSAALNALYTSLGTAVTSAAVTVTGAYGAAGATPSIATAKGWTVTN